MKSPNDLKQVRTRMILDVVLLNLVVFTVFCGIVLWLTFRSVGTVLHDETMNRILIMTDEMGKRAAGFLEAGEAGALKDLLQEAMSHPEIAYSFIRDADGHIVASTLEGNDVPDALKEINRFGRGVPFSTEEASMVSGGKVIRIVDVGAALPEGSHGSLHVGWNAELHQGFIRQIFVPIVASAAGLFVILLSLLVVVATLLIGRSLRKAD